MSISHRTSMTRSDSYILSDRNALASAISKYSSKIKTKSGISQLSDLSISNSHSSQVTGIQHNVKLNVGNTDTFVDVTLFERNAGGKTWFKLMDVGSVKTDRTLYYTSPLQEAWHRVDKNRNGRMTLYEFTDFMRTKAVEDKTGKLATFQIIDIFNKLDNKNLNEISFDRFSSLIETKQDGYATLTVGKDYGLAEFNKAWNLFDTDKNGLITLDDFARFLKSRTILNSAASGWYSDDNKEISSKTVRKMFYNLDKDGNGVIDRNEFLSMLKRDRDGHLVIFLNGEIMWRF